MNTLFSCNLSSLTVTAGVLLATFAAPTLSAVAAEEEPDIFTDEIEVRLINLEVRVTDKKGRHVADLGPADFRLEIDGEEVAIGYFSEIRDRYAVARPEASAASDLAAAPGPDAPALSMAGETSQSVALPAITPGERVGTSFLLFIDNDFGLTHDRQQFLDAFAETITGFEPGDQMAIVAYDGSRLELVGDWTSSPADLEQNLERARMAPAFGMRQWAARSLLDHDSTERAPGLSGEGDRLTRSGYIRTLSRRIERAMAAATSALRSFASAPGRKVMLLASGGWPHDPSAYAAGFNPQLRSDMHRDFPDEAFDELVSTANMLGYTLYPIDVPGNTAGECYVTASYRPDPDRPRCAPQPIPRPE